MSDFIMIAPEGWTQYVLNDIFNLGFSLGSLNDMTSSGNYVALTEVLRNESIIGEQQSVMRIQVLADSDAMWVELEG